MYTTDQNFGVGKILYTFIQLEIKAIKSIRSESKTYERFLSPNQHIIMICEGSCATEYYCFNVF